MSVLYYVLYLNPIDFDILIFSKIDGLTKMSVKSPISSMESLFLAYMLTNDNPIRSHY